uniref:Innexin n=1 Tax=Macrostomum lignano TaxID=282301 RepID=A0A1I8H775_9PLAT
MVMDIGLFGTLRKLKVTSSSLRVDDDFSDRLNHHYSGILLLIFTFIISAKQYVGKALLVLEHVNILSKNQIIIYIITLTGQPLQCWVPATYTKAMEQYAENYCWVQNTYYVPFDSGVPKEHSERRDRKIGYYQWVPFVLACEALLFYLPCILWRLLNWQTGVNFRALSRMALEAQSLAQAEVRARAVHSMASHVHDSITLCGSRPKNSGCCRRIRPCLQQALCFLCSKRHGCYLSYLYLIIKLLYLANCAGQFFLLNAFLGTRQGELFGIELLTSMLSGRNWEESGRFPRVTLCDFWVRTIADNHRHTVQCVLVINIFNEKIFVFLWFWIVLVATLTGLSFIAWTARQLVPASRTRFVVDFIKLANGSSGGGGGGGGLRRGEARLARQFAEEHLRSDGVFVLRLMAANAGDVVTASVVKELWSAFKKRYSNCVYDSDIV